MQMPGRKFSTGSAYRYGFNGKENDNEVKGEGNQQDYGMRIYDPRLVRFLSEDPITAKYPELTPYQFASNRPIDGIDEDGLEYSAVNANTNQTFTGPLNLSNLPAGDWNISSTLVPSTRSTKPSSGSNRLSFPAVSDQTFLPKSPTTAVGSINTKQSFIGPDNSVKRSPEEQAKVDVFSKKTGDQQRLENKRAKIAENDPISDVPVLGNISQMFKRLGSGDYSGSIKKAGLVAIDAALAEIGGNPASLRSGYGVFGENGLVVGGYKANSLYLNPRSNGATLLSIKQMKQGGSLFRIDYGILHKTGEMSLHATYRFRWLGKQIGSSKTQFPLIIF